MHYTPMPQGQKRPAAVMATPCTSWEATISQERAIVCARHGFAGGEAAVRMRASSLFIIARKRANPRRAVSAIASAFFYQHLLRAV